MLFVAGPLATCLFAFAMFQAAISDLTTMTIRNRLVLFLLGAYIVLAPLAGLTSDEILSSTVIALVVLVTTFALFTQGWFGGGDAKLAGVTALWLGMDHTFPYIIYTALLGGVLTIGLLQFRSCVLPATLVGKPWISRLHNRQTGVPYGIAMAAAALITFPSTPWMTWLL
jgi:prepilin peptidase CpaA